MISFAFTVIKTVFFYSVEWAQLKFIQIRIQFTQHQKSQSSKAIHTTPTHKIIELKSCEIKTEE